MGSALAANGGEAGLSVLLGTGTREREASRGERGEGERALGISLARGEGWGHAGQREAGGGVNARASSTQLLRSAGVEDDWQATSGLGQPAGPRDGLHG